MTVAHYENFPVASWLCPPHIRQAVIAVYHFARTADDIADEGDLQAPQRLEQLHVYRETLSRTLQGAAPDTNSPWAHIFRPLGQAHARHVLPKPLLDDLLDAFEQDVLNPMYACRAELLDYCRRSANPVGRLLLHLQGIRDPRLIAMSDQICTALQLINFWQDLSVDVPRGRCYIPLSDARAHGLPWPLRATCGHDPRSVKALVADLCQWAGQTMASGAGLPMEVGGRMGLELRLVVQGGLRVLEKIRLMDHQSFRHRPVLNAWDAPLLTWRAIRMRAAQASKT